MAGTVVADTIKGGTTAPPVFQRSDGTAIGELCTAWVNFDGTVAAASMIRDSFNVSSITDHSTGIYTANLTVALADNNFCAVASGGRGNTTDGIGTFGLSGTSGNAEQFTTTSVKVTCSNQSFTVEDFSTVCIAIFGGR